MDFWVPNILKDVKHRPGLPTHVRSDMETAIHESTRATRSAIEAEHAEMVRTIRAEHDASKAAWEGITEQSPRAALDRRQRAVCWAPQGSMSRTKSIHFQMAA